MPPSCASPTCERVSRGLCDCCKQNLCLQHLNEHNAQLLSQLNVLADEINVLGDRFNSFQLDEILKHGRDKLKQWQKDCHEKIDRLFEQKCKELEQLATEKVLHEEEILLNVQYKLTKLIRNQEATQNDINNLRANLRQLEKDMHNIERTCFRIDTKSLEIDDSAVHITEIDEHDLNLSTVASIYRTLESPIGSYVALASNDEFLLIHQKPYLRLVDRKLNVAKEILWEHKTIWDMCWSSVLEKFIVIEDSTIFLVDEKTMCIENTDTIEKRKWLCGTCSNVSLFLSTKVWGSSIVQLSLWPSITFVKEWKSPTTCNKNERIDGIAYCNQRLAMVIMNNTKQPVRIELRCCLTLDRIWTHIVDGIFNSNYFFSCCSLICDEWLVTSYESKQLLHMTKNGKVKAIIPYDGKPYFARIFGSCILAVSNTKGINFHKI